MKTMMHKFLEHCRKNAFIYRILLVFFGIAVSFLMLILVFFQHMNGLAKQEFIEKESRLFIENTTRLSGRLTQLYQNSTGFLSNDSLTPHFKSYHQLTREDRIKLPAMIQGLLNLQVVNSDVAGLFFLLIDSEYVYSANGLHKFSSFFQNVAYMNKYPEKFWEELLASDEIVHILRVLNNLCKPL